MTTPHEWRRNWLWARKLLIRPSEEEVASGPVRKSATELLMRFPAQFQLDTTRADAQSHLFSAYRAELDQARRLLSLVRSDPRISQMRRDELLIILRHLV
jgi:hypothetical protein